MYAIFSEKICIHFNPILHGLLEIRYYMGGSKQSPPIKIHQNDSDLVKRHVLTKIDYFCPLFMHLELNYYHFWPKKGPKNQCIFTRIEGSPLWILCGKNCKRKIFWKFQKEIPKMAFPGPFKYWKEQSHEKSVHLGHPRRISVQ